MDEMNSGDGPDEPGMTGMSRRRMLAGVGAGAATVWVAPVVTRVGMATAAASPPPPPPPSSQTFDLYTSFKASLSAPANPTIDGFSFLQASASQPFVFTKLTFGSTGTAPFTALPSYHGSESTAFGAFPVAAINTSSGPDVSGGVNVPPMSVVLHPGPTLRVAVGFNIPATATAVNFTATFTDIDLAPTSSAADGVKVGIFARRKSDHAIVALTSPSAQIGDATGPPIKMLSGPVNPATYDIIYAIVNPNTSYSNDSTRLDFTITTS